MSVNQTKVIDGIAYDEESKKICLLLSDHLDWSNEYDHLKLLQDKLNTYAYYIQTKQYEKQYSEKEILQALIEIHFKYDISKTVEKFLQVAQDNFGEAGILIECHIEE
ncbi:MAG: hypothetical protein IJ530_04430 [Treponema sp.]|uniref:DUF6572 domain-containing protein n=1 Tax=Treponema sp. TaxID=166 RepID=UPI0025CF4016|nr:DUF6572 domain-containing protein [Treponema sp.]MBQ8678992.1 hypothetical protein [Treponema sp.]